MQVLEKRMVKFTSGWLHSWKDIEEGCESGGWHQCGACRKWEVCESTEKPSKSLTLGTFQWFNKGFLSDTHEPNWRSKHENRKDNCFIEETSIEDTKAPPDRIGKDVKSRNYRECTSGHNLDMLLK
jgi:hypothetical protein